MLQVSTLLREVIASMSVTLKIDSVEASGSNWKVYCSNTQYLNTLSELEIGSVQYVVESFVQDEYLILEGAVEPTPGIFALRNPTFKHGKYQAVLTELSDPQDLDIMPLIWMLENQQRTRPSELDSKIESEGQVRLFFANTDDWSRDTEQMYEEILNPVLTLVNLFLVELEANKRTGDFGVIETTNHAKLTIGGGDLGSTEAQGIFQRTLSGIEVTINLPIMVDFDCSDTASTRVCPQVSILDANGNIITMVDAGSSYTVSGGGGSGFVENSDSSYTNTVASGATLVLPDITVTDSDGSTSSVPSVQNVLCTPSADATVENSDSSYTNTVASGGTLTLPDITVTDSDGSTFTQASVVNVVCSLAADGTVNVNSVFFDNVTSGGTLNIEVRQSSGSTLIGSKQGAHFRIPDSVITLDNTDGSTLSTTNVLATDASTITAPDATAVIKNTLNAVLRSELVPSNVSEDIIIGDATININQSDGTLIASATVTAEGSGVYNVADSTVNVVNTLGTVLSSNSVKATVTDTVLAPDANVENSDNSYTNTVESAGTLTLSDITVTYPSGATEAFPAAINITASADVSDEIFLEADSVVESGGAVSVMTDQGGKNNNANQHVGSTQPSLVASDASYNNQPVVVFAADQMYFDRPFAAHLKDGFSFFFVGRVDTVARFDWLGSKYGNTVCSLGGFEDLGYTRIRTKELSASTNTTQNTATNLDTDGIWTLIGTGASTNLYLNGVLVISASQHQENGSFGWLGALSTQLRSRGRFGTMTFRNGYDLTQINARGSAFGTKYGFTWTTIV